MFVCIITNTETRRTYQLYFKRVFQLISECLQKQIYWKHIHSGEEGFEAVTSDINSKQMAGVIPKIYLKCLPNILQKGLGGIYSILTLKGTIGCGILRKH